MQGQFEGGLLLIIRSIARKGGLVAALLLFSGFVIAAGAGCSSPSPVVKKVDHVAVMVSDPQQLFDFFTQTLGLPQAWPVARYPQFSTGGVKAGNVNIELLHFGPPPAQPTPAFYYGIVFSPYPLDQSVPALQARGAEPGKPTVQQGEFNGKVVTMWTNVTLNALSQKDYIVYLCEYAPAVGAKLASGNSTGPLGGIGLESVSEVTLTSKDTKTLEDTWNKALAPAKFNPDGVMQVDGGPSIRVTKGDGENFVRLVFEVVSLSEATTFLAQQGLLVKSATGDVSIDPARIQGLDIRIVQKK